MKEPRRKKQKNNGKHTSLVQIPSSIPDILQQGDVEDVFNSGTTIQNVEPKSLQNTLDQIEQDVTQIMSSIVQKKPKATLHQLNTKLDYIISILRSDSFILDLFKECNVLSTIKSIYYDSTTR